MRALLVLAVLGASCSSAPSELPAEVNPAVVARIEGLTDCAALQKEFDTAEANGERERAAGNLARSRASTEYMEAALARMNVVGC